MKYNSNKISYISKYLSTLKQLHSLSYTKEKKYFDKVVSSWLYFVTRPISIFVTPVFFILKISATQITFIGFIIGLFSLYSGFVGALLISSILYNIFLIFDCIDGNIARLTKPTKKGEYIDAITGDIINFLFIPAIGFGLFFNKNQMFLDNSFIENNIFVMALISSIFYLLCVLVSQRKKIIFKKAEGPTRIMGNESVSLIELFIRNSFGFAFNAPMSIIFTIFGVLDLLIIYNLSIMPLLLVFTIFRK